MTSLLKQRRGQFWNFGYIIGRLPPRQLNQRKRIRWLSSRKHVGWGDKGTSTVNSPLKCCVSCLNPTYELTGECYGPVHLALACPQDEEDPWLIVSDELTGPQTFRRGWPALCYRNDSL